MFALTTSFFLVEIIVGYITNSMALVTDSFHKLSDVTALVIAFLSAKVRLLRFDPTLELQLGLQWELEVYCSQPGLDEA